jgi:glycosyltransferase involved in cell wall biosynthesis
MIGQPLVSAIIATYNRGYIVCEAIDSIINQTHKNVEIIVVDDGSTDDTQGKLRKYGDKIRIVYQKNSGPAEAWNSGIKASHGAIICFLGSDDVWLPTFVERHVAALEKAGPAVPCSISNAVTKFANGVDAYSFELAGLRPNIEEGLWVNVLDVFATRFVMCGQMFAIRRELFDRIGFFDRTLRYLEDLDIALKLALEGPWCFIREPLVLYRQSSKDSISLSVSSADADLHVCVVRIQKRIRERMQSRKESTESRHLLRAIRKAQRSIWASRAAQDPSPIKRALGKFYRLLDHYESAIYRRSPFYPKMKAIPFESANLQDHAESHVTIETS